MGEVVVSSEEMKTESEKQRSTEMMMKKNSGGESSSGVVMRWEKLLPGMNMRVLLVEADDSTRHIIAALLKKCSYRVAAVPDGLKAWEILKSRSHKIDLILMEVDLPSISGFALLTLIMEHEICKNIPVIMMSSQDSINTVYKCMTRGVSDYLVKPIRKNELRNLWQHVWRRQSLARNNPQDESVGQQKIEGTSDNDAAINDSSDYVACAQRNKENIEKGTDSQSSCTKPDFDAESVDMQELSQKIQAKNFLDDLRVQKDEGNTNCGEKLLMHENETRGPTVNAYKDNLSAPLGEVTKPGSHRRDANLGSEACDDNDLMVNSTRNVTDFFGVSSSYQISNQRNSSSSNRPSTYDSAPQLDLSLRRSDSSGFETQVPEKRHSLGRSNASAFSRYINRPLQPQNPLTGINERQKAYETTSEKPPSPVNMDCDTPAATSSIPRSVITLATGQSNQSEIGTSCPQQRLFPLPVPVKGVRFNNLCNGYGTAMPPTFCTKSSPSPMPSTAAQQEPSFLMSAYYPSNPQNHKPEQVYDAAYHNSKAAMEQTMQQLEQRFDEDRGHISPNNDQSATSSFCNGNASHLNRNNSMGYGSACGSNNIDQGNQAAIFRAAPESKNEDSFFNQSGNNRSIQREAALNKFRMKRKDRCYEKKVRYESRKKLAEQRPRIKGQFVRQVADPLPTEAAGNAYDD